VQERTDVELGKKTFKVVAAALCRHGRLRLSIGHSKTWREGTEGWAPH